MPELRDGEIVRILIPNHPGLAGQPGRALDFGGVMRRANDPDNYFPGEEPWRLPARLVDPALEEALDAILLHPWIRQIDDDDILDDPDCQVISLSTANLTDTGVTDGGLGRMGVLIATATRDQLELLAAARDLIADAIAAPYRSRTAEQAEIASFAESMAEAEANDEIEASISSWFLLLRLFDIAVTDTPATEHRPDRLLDERAKQVRLPDPAGTAPAADTALLLGVIDTTPGGRDVVLDTTGADALRRLQTEWHTAIYGDKADSGDTLLSSYLY